MCTLLFADAEDPLGALRWSLSAARSLLGEDGRLVGDPLRLELADDVLVDLRELEAGRLELVEQWGALGSDLLEPLDFSGSATFAVWLEIRRRQVRGLTEGLVHERVQIELARGAARRAAELSAVLVRMEPLDEGHQALLVRSLAAAGDGVGAARQVAACRELFRRELGTEPGVWLDAAARVVTRHPVAAARTGRPSVVASIDAGVAAVEAGSVDAGVECLRRAVDEGAALGDPELEVRALTELGTALVHSVRGRDDEGAVALHRAVARAGDRFPAWVAVATRELGYVEFLRGRYDRVEPWLSRATAAAAGDVAQLARIAAVRGCALTDVARYAEAEVALRYAVEHTRDDRFRSYPWSMLGRVHLLRGELALAADALDTSLDLALHTGWTALVPWPDALRAEVDLLRGDPDAAADRSRRAFLASCRLGDPCWEGISGRVRGLLHAAQGQPEQALAALADARVRCTRLPDGYVWVDALILETTCTVARDVDPDLASAAADELVALAARCGLAELLWRGLRHQADLGREGAGALAEALGAELEWTPRIRRWTTRP